MNTTPVTPCYATVIRNVFFPAIPVNKAAKTIFETQAVSEVRRAINAWEYGGEDVVTAEECPACDERAVFGGKCHACPFDAR